MSGRKHCPKEKKCILLKIKAHCLKGFIVVAKWCAFDLFLMTLPRYSSFCISKQCALTFIFYYFWENPCPFSWTLKTNCTSRIWDLMGLIYCCVGSNIKETNGKHPRHYSFENNILDECCTDMMPVLEDEFTPHLVRTLVNYQHPWGWKSNLVMLSSIFKGTSWLNQSCFQSKMDHL